MTIGFRIRNGLDFSRFEESIVIALSEIQIKEAEDLA